MNLKIKYRPEIDGLRGIAVLAVIFFHFDFILTDHDTFKGGYIGVDIFFVISGYLISCFIFNELKITKSFSFLNFYKRRVRRLLPVLLIVILFSITISSFLFLPDKFIFFTKSVFSSWFFISNIFFWKQGTVYNAEESIDIPLLHTWSLSVEEQFYIIFPVTVIILIKFFKKYILAILLSGFLISFFLANWASLYYPGANFYMLPTRGWEILAGSLIAYFEVFKNKKFECLLKEKILISLSLFFLFYFIFFVPKDIYHPSVLTVFPILSVALIICYSRNNNFMMTKILSSKIMVFFGLISYSLYLWHYPIFIFLKNLNLSNSISLEIKIFSLLLIFLLSVFTYYVVEKPTRNKNFNFKYLLGAIIIFSIFIAFLNLLVVKKEGFPQRFSKDFQKEIFYTKQIECDKIMEVKRFCTYNENLKKKQTDIILMGDSLLVSFIRDLKEKISSKNYRLVNFTRGGLFYSPYGKYINKKNGFSDDEKEDRFITKFLNKKDNERFIIILANYKRDLKENNFIYVDDLGKKITPFDLVGKKRQVLFKKGLNSAKRDFKKLLYELLEKDKVILIYPYPDSKLNIMNSINVQNIKSRFFNFKSDRKSVSYSKFLIEQKEIFDLFDAIDHKNLFKIYPHKNFCDSEKKKCFFDKKGKPLISDKIHLTYFGSKKINDQILQIIENN